MKKNISIFIVGLALVSVGCSSNISREVISPDAGRQITEQESPEIKDAVQADLEIAAPLETGNLTLPTALALALRGSPELQSFSYNMRVGEARLIQAGLRPNPEISLAVEDVLGSGDYRNGEQAQTTLLLSQVIELGGKRSARTDVAAAYNEQLKFDYEIKRVEILSDVTDKFIRTVADEYLLKLAERAEGLAKHALENIKTRAAAGGTSELEESKAEVLLARAHIAKEHAEHELRTSKRELAALWGSESAKFDKLDAQLFQTVSVPSLSAIDAQLDDSLEIKRWVSEKRLREAEEKLALAKSIPNLAFGFGPRRIEGPDAESWVFQLSMPLSIFDRNQGGIAEAHSLKAKSVVDEQKSRLRLKTVLFGLYQELNHSLTELAAMKAHIIPQAERSLEVAQQGYNQGRFSYLELLDTQRTLLEVNREQIEAAYLFHHYANAIERLLGVSINSSASNNS